MMLRRICFPWALALLCSWLLFPFGGDQLQAQVRIPVAAQENDARLQEILASGRQLEAEQRWGEALTHYERAAKDYPNHSLLQQQLTLARIQYDVGRRYANTSFTSAISQLTEREALEIYSEVMLKVQTYYVDTPSWDALVKRGTSNLHVALARPVSLAHLAPAANQATVESARQELLRTMNHQPARSRHDAYNQVAMAARLMQSRLGIPPQATILEYICGATGALDIYSAFLTRDQYNEVMSQIEGNFVGLGIEIRGTDGTLEVVNVISGGSAHESGMRAGERIIAVDGQATANMSTDKAADLLKGEEGSFVTVTLQSPTSPARLLRLQRKRIEIPSVEDIKIIDRQHGIGYLKLTSFQKTTTRDFNNALWQLHHQGMRSLIVDVRGNPGGLLDASVDIADKFVSSGTIVATRGRNPREDFDHQAKRFGTWQVPLVVLVDGNSASASEIFAGAISDHNRGIVVGERSYGKGSVQGIFPLSRSGAGVRLTTAKFFSPSGRAISGNGVSPHVHVQTAKKVSTSGEPVSSDTVLQSAVQVARTRFNNR